VTDQDVRSTVVILAGPSGSGKTTVGQALASTLGAAFVDTDALHSAANLAKMGAGQPLDENDRRPWLNAVRSLIDAQLATMTPTVLACSALRRAHRQTIGASRPGVRLVWLAVPAATLADRLPARPGHFFPAQLLEPQLAIQEVPEADEAALVVAGDRPTTDVVQAVIAALADDAGG
jgi:carbohydrate kinase (thermoresistant glucokinase family)